CLRCLLENASEAMASKGRLVLSASRKENRVHILVTDEGPGILPEMQEQLLAAFYTTKPGHIGLGLNVARRIALRYEGSLTFAPVERGACVSLSFPVFST